MLIHALCYEPRGQRQRFEPREQQSHEVRNRHLHLHLNLHLHLDLSVRLRRVSPTAVARVTTIFAAFLGALSMALSLYLQQATSNLQQAPLFTLAGNIIQGGAWLGLIAVLLGGIPLVVAAWRSTPRSRNLLLGGLCAPWLIIFLLLLNMMAHLGPTFGNILFPLLFYGGPLLSTIAITRALRQAEIADKWLRFATHLSRLVVLGMVLMLVGVVLWGFALALFAPGWFAVLLPLLAFPWDSWLLIAVVVALWASFRQVHPPASQPRPKDASPFDVDSSQEPRGYRG